MSESSRLLLRRSLVDGYAQMLRRLTRRLGSDSLASEALSETWLQLGKGGELGQIADADAYVYRAALNTASALGKRERRQSAHADIAEIPEPADETPLADRVVSSRQEVERMLQALAELPERQRDAFLQCYRGDTPPELLAERYQVSVRTIQNDIRGAILHCADRLGRKNVFAGRRVNLSSQ
ncbi:RNA polymerase sigma factor [Sandaracinobacter sp. RS1-74]|uniref:RNA polymerase sigma factor n=1 Tax=Sandaracinobacteroides sayramensis TaxID=2913411 RepID=UPI001EDAB17B|nr:RNA polymerase sigma factor [Sandaracinobacteroides sayramensis]MCG2840442.1 RNA polymerase sigma factor [Sandaracinobacteroides sayramensis]